MRDRTIQIAAGAIGLALFLFQIVVMFVWGDPYQ